MCANISPMKPVFLSIFTRISTGSCYLKHPPGSVVKPERLYINATTAVPILPGDLRTGVFQSDMFQISRTGKRGNTKPSVSMKIEKDCRSNKESFSRKPIVYLILKSLRQYLYRQAGMLEQWNFGLIIESLYILVFNTSQADTV